MASEHNNWPAWLKLIWPTWLENIGYPETGVGDLDDLRFKLAVGNAGLWVGHVNPGWYYHDNKEQYHYVVRGVQTFTASGSGSQNATISFRPSWGPLLLSGIGSTGLTLEETYRQHHNAYSPGITLSWSSAGTGGIYVATAPSSSIIVGMRDLSTLPLGNVVASGLVTGERLFHYDIASNKVFIRPPDPATITIYADLLYRTQILRMRELVVQRDSLVKPSYKCIEDVQIKRGDQTDTTSVTGFQSTSDAFAHAITGTVDGDWLVLDYLISKSYTLIDHDTFEFYVGGVSGSTFEDTVSAFFETSIPDTLPPVTITNSITGTLDFNPLDYQGHRAGYVYHANPVSAWSAYWKPDALELQAEKEEICGTWNELCKFTFILRDQNGLTIPWNDVTFGVFGGSAVVSLPGTGQTDAKGEIHVIAEAIPLVGDSAVLTVSGTVGALSATASVLVLQATAMIDSQRWWEGTPHTIISNQPSKDGGLRGFSYAAELDGIPRSTESLGIEVNSLFASEYTRFSANPLKFTGSITLQSVLLTGENPTGYAEFSYFPQPGDLIVSRSGTFGLGKIKRGEPQ